MISEQKNLDVLVQDIQIGTSSTQNKGKIIFLILFFGGLRQRRVTNPGQWREQFCPPPGVMVVVQAFEETILLRPNKLSQVLWT